MEFKIGNSKHKIGSKLFPVSSKSKMKVFNSETTVDINDYPDFLSALNSVQFESGRCYSNAEVTRKIGNTLGVNIEYYCGWLFLGDTPPLHHAWTVIDGNTLLDTSLSIREFMIMINSAELMKTDPNWRDKVAKELREYQKNKFPTTQDCIIGQVPEAMVYVGSPDEYEHAKRIFRNLSNNYPNHPSYQRKMNMKGASELQKKVWGHE